MAARAGYVGLTLAMLLVWQQEVYVMEVVAVKVAIINRWQSLIMDMKFVERLSTDIWYFA